MQYLYTFGFDPGDESLCRLEQRALFGKESAKGENYILSDICIPPSRSPFIRERVDVAFAARSLEELQAFVANYSVGERSFKLICMNAKAIGPEPKMGHSNRRQLEIAVAESMPGEVDLDTPDVKLAVAKIGDMLYFGELVPGEAVWRQHIDRPVQYSTALSAKHARALVNITAPVLEDVRIVDPCCGVGTVVIEALSMGANILGRDINCTVTSGSRSNIAHFGYNGTIELGPIEEITETFDAAIIDMPYNLFTHSSDDNRQSIIESARRIAKRIVLVSSEDLQLQIDAAQLEVRDSCTIRKQKFVRNVYVCN